MISKDSIIYLDYASACPLDPEIATIFTEDFLEPGNPSSIHRLGQKKRQKIDEARKIFQDLLGAKQAKECLFYGSGTEAVWAGLRGLIQAMPKGVHVVSSASEHPAVVETLKSLEQEAWIELTWLYPDASGRHKVQEFEEKSQENTRLWVMMAVNNETGVIQDLASWAKAARERNILSFTDACQMGSKMRVTLEEYPVDALVLNSAKLYGPVGFGLLYKRENIPFHAMMTGGGQEFRQRGGTENASGILAFAKAFEKCQQGGDWARLEALSLFFEGALKKMPEIQILGGSRVKGLWTLYVPWMSAESLVMRMDMEGFAISAGSACSSGVTKASPVLVSMGLADEVIKNSIRISLGRWTTQEQLEKCVQSLLFIRESLL